jgi:hypothetical protein
VAGPVQSGGGQQFVSGRDQAVHHGDVHNEVRTDIDLSTPWDEAVTGKGIGRLILLLGGLTALAGFALWLWLLLSAQAGGSDPFALEIAGMPAGAVGMGGSLADWSSLRSVEPSPRPPATANSRRFETHAPRTAITERGSDMSDSHATFGNVTGPVQTGGGTQYVSGGHQYVTGGGAPSPWPGGGASPVSDSDVTECLRELARHVAQLG